MSLTSPRKWTPFFPTIKVVYHRCWSLIFETMIQYVKLIERQSFLAVCRALNQGACPYHVNFGVNWTYSLGARALAVKHEC